MKFAYSLIAIQFLIFLITLSYLFNQPHLLRWIFFAVLYGLLVGFMRKTDWKTYLGLRGILIGSFVGCVVLEVVVFGNRNISIVNLSHGLLCGIPIGAIFGWTFGVMLGDFVDRRRNKHRRS